MPADISVIDWTLRLVVAALLSGVVGFEREARQKAAGLRTHMLVGLGAALFTLVGAYAFEGSDPTRVAAQVVTGVGFLGAGAIFRQGATVSGLTTAAGLWAVAAIGMTAGAGLIEGSVVATLVTVIILYVLGTIERYMRARRAVDATRPVGVTLTNLSELNEVVRLTCALDEQAREVGVERMNDDSFIVTFDVRPARIDTIAAAVRSFDTVLEAREVDPAVTQRTRRSRRSD